MPSLKAAYLSPVIGESAKMARANVRIVLERVLADLHGGKQENGRLVKLVVVMQPCWRQSTVELDTAALAFGPTTGEISPTASQ
jgi:hypothetical protein